jgi:hypothetical protein
MSGGNPAGHPQAICKHNDFVLIGICLQKKKQTWYIIENPLPTGKSTITVNFPPLI